MKEVHLDILGVLLIHFSLHLMIYFCLPGIIRTQFGTGSKPVGWYV